jgi:hypothetical protein
MNNNWFGAFPGILVVSQGSFEVQKRLSRISMLTKIV